ncbi:MULTISPECIES: phage tail protein [Clostridia]|uniref:phage tail protein n=3 Tax=Bacillota TaxID=1239 RepID=UPI0028FEC477|nr:MULTISPECIES: phage tail protein [Clostridia]MDU1175698.1 phage tail protein [Peptostreptococcus anaerobius]MDU1232158.1 phage tail protein [Clostridium sp.]MDU1233615.1 phage tail protein [Peptostreptococcus anaerobius]
MYKVYCDGALIYDPRDDEFTLLNPKVDIEVNKAGSMDFTILPGHSSYDKINKLKSHISVKQDGKEIWAGRPTDVVTDFMNRKKVHCEGELAYLNDSVQRPKEYKGVSVIGYLNHLMDNHNAQVDDDKKFKVGVVTVRDQNDYLLRYTNWETTLKAISEDLVDSLGGYIFIRNENGVRYIDYLADFMHTNTQKIEFGENMLNFSKNFDTTDVATCVIPLGARLENSKIEALGERVTIESVNGGVDSIVSQEAVKLYGKISKTVVYDDVKIPSNLLKKGTDYLKAAQWERMTLEAKALDLHFVDGSFEQFKVGEYVRVVSKPHGMDANFPLVKMSIKLDKVSDNTVTLGIKKNLSLSASTIEASSEIKKQLEMVPKRYDVIKLAKENATNIISKVMGGFVVKTENELLVMDTDDIKTAKNVWRWNVNGLGFSRNGYDGPYETAMTMDGAFVADMITTGILKGGNVHFNLNEGTFLIGKSESDYLMKYDGNKLQFGIGSMTGETLSNELKEELKGESFKYNLISNGDFHIDFTKDEPGHNSKVLNRWQAKSRSDVEKIYIKKPIDKNWTSLEVSGTDRIEINQYLNLKKNTKYYIKATIASERMMLYYHGSSYNSIATVKDNYEHFTTINTSFTTEDSDTHYIQLDCTKKTRVRDVIISEEPISNDTEWYPSKFDGIGQDGKPGRDGRDGERGAQGPPGRDGRDGSMVDLPPALKDWSGKATEISGKYVFTPELFVGTNGDSKYSRTGIYMGSGIKARDLFDNFTTFDGITGINNGTATWHLSVNGNGWIGNSQRAMWWNKDGELTLPKVKAREIEAGAITTDILYPGTNERIILEEGYSPGANDCKSIDANGDAIRLKVNAGTYIAMKDTGSIGMYSRGSQFFSFNPNVGWDWGSASGDGELNLYDAHVIMGWLGYYVYSVRSDRRVKDNIKYIKNNDSTINRNNIFDFVKSVDLATYQYKKIGGNNISMIAQDVQKFRFIQDYLVVKDTEGLLSINMGNYHSMVHITLQEEIKKREELESKVNKLENELEEIKKLLKKEGE